MLIVACAFAGLAALVHVYIFVIEALRFESPSTLQTFGIKAADAAVLKPVFYNQGFYNLFLAVGTLVGIGFVVADRHEAGVALVVFGVGSMLAAATVLVSSDGSKARAALVQGLFPALTLVCLLLWALFR
jgi:putative membrane protein